MSRFAPETLALGRMAIMSLLVITLMIGLRAAVSVAAQPEADHGGEILFVRHAIGEPGGEGVYVINADGTGERLLFLFEDIGLPYDVFNEGLRCPQWSPDGTQLAFNVYDSEQEMSSIVITDVDGSNLRRVIELPDVDGIHRQIGFPMWTPDGSQISFGLTYSQTGNYYVTMNGLGVVNLDGSDFTVLLDTLPTTYSDGSASVRGNNYLNPLFHSWSPDGEQVAIATFSNDAFVYSLDDASLAQVTDTDYDAYAIDWSPDGSVIAVGQHTLRLVSPDGSTLNELIGRYTELPSVSYESVSWSPDGSQLAYITFQADIQDEYVYWFILSIIDVATGETRELLRTPIAIQAQHPQNIACVDWRPAGAPELPPPPVLPPTLTPLALCTITAQRDVNVRAEPTTSAAIVDSLGAGERVQVDRQTSVDGFVWYHLMNEGWVRGDTVSAEASCAMIAVA